MRTKEKIEVDFLVELPNQKFLAIEVKSTPQDYTQQQLKLLDSLEINIIGKWILTISQTGSYGDRKIVPLLELFHELEKVLLMS